MGRRLQYAMGMVMVMRLINSCVVKLQLGAEKFRAPEILFDPTIIGQEYSGVHECVVNSINSSDMDLRRTLYENILLSGGSTLFKGR